MEQYPSNMDLSMLPQHLFVKSKKEAKKLTPPLPEIIYYGQAAYRKIKRLKAPVLQQLPTDILPWKKVV